ARPSLAVGAGSLHLPPEREPRGAFIPRRGRLAGRTSHLAHGVGQRTQVGAAVHPSLERGTLLRRAASRDVLIEALPIDDAIVHAGTTIDAAETLHVSQPLRTAGGDCRYRRDVPIFVRNDTMARANCVSTPFTEMPSTRAISLLDM